MLKIFSIILIFLLSIALVSIGYYKTNNVFNSPDESSNFISMTQFSKTNKLYYKEGMSNFDVGNNLHPRGFLTIKNKVVPFNFPGIWIMYGVIHKFIGENVKYINLLYFSLIYLAVYKILFVVIKEKANFALISLLSIICNLPIIYYLNFPYLNITPAVTFFSLALFFLIKYNKQTENNYLFVISVIFASISLWFASYWLLFYFYIYGVQVATAIKEYKSKLLSWTLSLVLVVFIFFVPLLILNNALYGSPFTLGMTVFTKTFFYEERSSNIYKNLITYLLPSREIKLGILLKNISTSLLFLSPIYFITAYCGLLKLLKKFRKLSKYIPLLIWFTLYSGMSDTYLGGSVEVTNLKSVIRYWLPLYFFLSISFSYYLIYLKNRRLKLLLIFGSLIALPFLFNELSVSNLRLKLYQEINSNYKIKMVENSYILTASDDKFLFQIAKPITWWQSYEGDKYFEPFKLNGLIENLLKEKKSVYIQGSNKLDSNKISQIVNNNLYTKQLSRDLYKVELKQ